MSGVGDLDHLYKYRSLAGESKDRTCHIISDSAIWFSKPADFNDPFDCFPVVKVPANKTIIIDYMKSLIEQEAPFWVTREQKRTRLRSLLRDPSYRPGTPQFIARLRTFTEQSANMIGVLSLSARRDNMLMWSHYASAHTGICLRFNAALSLFHAAQKVTYHEERPTVDLVEDYRNPTNELVVKLLLTKADFWAYEEEWRVIGHPKSSIKQAGGEGLVPFTPRALDGVILGARTSDADATEVAQWLKRLSYPVELLRARPNRDRFCLDIVPFDEIRNDERSISISGHPS